MNKWTLYFNRHMYADNSDTPRASHKIFIAESKEDAENAFYDWRELSNATAGGTDGRKKFIGMHTGTREGNGGTIKKPMFVATCSFLQCGWSYQAHTMILANMRAKDHKDYTKHPAVTVSKIVR